MFRLVWWDHKEEDKFAEYVSERVYEFYGDRSSIFTLWVQLTQYQGYPHVEVYNKHGVQMDIKNGRAGMLE